MERFYIVILSGTDSKKFVQSIYRNSISDSSDIGDGIYTNSQEDAEALRRVVIERTSAVSDRIKIYKEVTTSEII